MAPRRHHSAVCIGLILLCACGSSAQARPGSTTTEPEPAVVDIGLRTTADDWIEVATLQGRPLVLFMFATFDGGSQAMLRPLRGVVARRQNILFVGIAAQPRAEALLDAWAYALNPPFVVAFDPTDAVQKGLTALGELESVPALIFVGADGYERGRLFGVQQERVIDAWLDKMLRVKQAPAQQR